jgi:hypothetical protein
LHRRKYPPFLEATVTPPPFPEASLHATLRDLGVQIAGTRLEPILAEFDREREQVGLSTPQPHYYLSDEWGVPFPSVAIAIPFYLARPDLTALHAARTGLVEGASRADILRYLRHELGHVVSYAYKLYEREGWAARFGAFTRPYPEEYTPRPFSRDYVRHLPGWYAQKHPDEDWAETFAVWMTPGRDWRQEYTDWPVALAKLEYCDRIVREVAGTPPLLNSDAVPPDDPDEDGLDIFALTLADLYGEEEEEEPTDLPGLDGDLRTAFEDAGTEEPSERRPVGQLVRALEPELVANVFRWTGHFPERTLPLVRAIARRADELQQVYPADREQAAAVAITTLVTALAMNHVIHGTYFPQSDEGGE